MVSKPMVINALRAVKGREPIDSKRIPSSWFNDLVAEIIVNVFEDGELREVLEILSRKDRTVYKRVINLLVGGSR